MNEPKSIFLKLDEATGIISSNPHLNKVFIKNEIFNHERLKELGFDFVEDEFQSKHSKEESQSILNDISSKVAAKVIDTRKNRGKVFEILDKKNRITIENNSLNSPRKIHLNSKGLVTQPVKRLSPRTKKKIPLLFNGVIYLKSGQASDLYRDIVDLHNYYHEKKDHFSQYFPSLIRMSMRLLTEAAASDVGVAMDIYLKTNFVKAKSTLDANAKTTLSTQNVSEGTIVQLLHIGAHNYKAANNLDQTIAVSIILGKILEITHGR